MEEDYRKFIITSGIIYIVMISISVPYTINDFINFILNFGTIKNSVLLVYYIFIFSSYLVLFLSVNLVLLNSKRVFFFKEKAKLELEDSIIFKEENKTAFGHKFSLSLYFILGVLLIT